MTIRIVTEFGDEIFYELPFALGGIPKSISFVSLNTLVKQPVAAEEAKPSPKPKEVVPIWCGLWLTDSQTFVEVVTNEEAYFLRENGTRLVRCSVNHSGVVSIDGAKSCRLMERRLGDKSTPQLGKKPWPKPKGM